MKNKLTALLAALLLCLSLLPSQTNAAFDPTDNNPPAVSEQGGLENSEPAPSEQLAPQSDEDPGLTDKEH